MLMIVAIGYFLCSARNRGKRSRSALKKIGYREETGELWRCMFYYGIPQEVGG